MIGKPEIREFIRKLIAGYGDDEPINDDDSLLNSGRLQSIDAVEIVIFLETRFGIDFATIGFDRDRIDSIDAIYSLAESASNGQA